MINVSPLAVGEDEEVSIKEIADAIVKAVGFEGQYSVRLTNLAVSSLLVLISSCSLIRLGQMVNFVNQHRTKSSWA